jgi:hypothetical protein
MLANSTSNIPIYTFNTTNTNLSSYAHTGLEKFAEHSKKWHKNQMTRMTTKPIKKISQQWVGLVCPTWFNNV